MSNGAIRFSEEVEYYTPKYIVDKFGPFDYDPATTEEQAKKLNIARYDTEETNGLNSDWSEYLKIWVNPPFTKKFEFLKKAVDTMEESYGEIFFLLPISALTTKKFYDITIGKCPFDLYIPNGRIKFENKLGNAKSPAFGSVILHFYWADGYNTYHLEI